ncbi:MAG TPA: hypothetical protein VK929_13330 [Longimicrobiales bacterium]|nr:hypothetical protein [Longimicrobiales bacterium]
MTHQDHDLLTKVGRSYVRHQHEDGLDELESGVDMAVMGIALYIMALSLRQQIDYWWFTVAIFLALAISVTRDRVKERIRQRVTYPRIGYASAERGEPLSATRKKLMWLILLPMAAAPVVIAVLLLTGRMPDLRTAAEWGRWAPAVYGILAGAATWWDAERFGIRRFRVSGVMTGVTGIVASLAGTDVVSASAFFCMGWGAINLTTGGITLWRFRSAYDSGTP